VLLPTVLALLLVVAGLGVVGSAQVRVQQAAGAAARELARGAAPPDLATTAGHGATASTRSSGGVAVVTVTRRVELLGFGGLGVTVKGSAAARPEKSEP